MDRIRQWFGVFDLSVLIAAILLWVFGEQWGKSAEHFGYEIWPLLAVLGVLTASPVYALISSFRRIRHYLAGNVSVFLLVFRLLWSFVICVHFLILVWAPGDLR